MQYRDLPDVLTADLIAKYLGLSKRRVYELMDISPEDGGMPCIRIGRSKRTLKWDLKVWINLRKEA